MAVTLALFLVQNGTPASKITILAPYHLQVQSIKSQYCILSERLVKIFASKELKRRPVICTPESFQGNDFTIMSLTRPYVDEAQRISVQSSTQKALCFIGNSAGLENSDSCFNFLLKLKEDKSLNKTITIQCEKHPSVSHEVKSTIDPIAQKGAINNKTELMYHLYNPAELCESIVAFEIPGCKHKGEKKCSAKIDLTKKCSAQVEVSCNGKSLPSHIYVVPCHDKSYGKVKKCRKPCDFVYKNCSHKCEQVCGSPHFHTSNSCNAMTTFTNPCGHLADGKKRCSGKYRRPNPSFRCQEIVYVKCDSGHHDVKTICSKEYQTYCEEPCMKKRDGCNHPCQKKCGEWCAGGECLFCEINQENETTKAKLAQQKNIEAFKKTARKNIDLLKTKISRQDAPKVSYEEINKQSPEFASVCDKTIKYTKPSHNWYPEIYKVEKVHNSFLELEFEKEKINGFGTFVDTKFHGTDDVGVIGITTNGFRLPSKAGMFGAGIYFATDSSKSAQTIYTKGSGKLLLCDVFLGDSLTIGTEQERRKFVRGVNLLESLSVLEKDSVFAPQATELLQNDEFIIFNPCQALTKYIIHYKDSSSAKSCSDNFFERKKFVDRRNINISDPYYHDFVKAAAHFLKIQQNRKIESVDIIKNGRLENHFNSQKLLFQTQGVPDNEILAYHATDYSNVDSILKNNLDPNRAAAHGRRFGNGCYFSENPNFSLNYGKALIVFRVLPGKEYVGSRSSDLMGSKFHSKKFSEDSDGYGEQLIIINPRQFLPAYVIESKEVPGASGGSSTSGGGSCSVM